MATYSAVARAYTVILQVTHYMLLSPGSPIWYWKYEKYGFAIFRHSIDRACRHGNTLTAKLAGLGWVHDQLRLIFMCMG